MRVADPVRSSQAESAGIKAYPQRKRIPLKKEEMKDQKECRRTTLLVLITISNSSLTDSAPL